MSGRGDILDRMDAEEKDRRLTQILALISTGHKLTDDDLRVYTQQVYPEALLVQGTTWQHKASGGIYRLGGLVLLEADLTPHVVYWPEAADPPARFARPMVEFLQKFIQVTQKMQWVPVESQS